MTSVSNTDSKGRSAALHSDPVFHHFYIMWVANTVKSVVFPSTGPLLSLSALSFLPCSGDWLILLRKTGAEEENDDRVHVLMTGKYQLLIWHTYQSAWTAASPESEAGV